MQNLPILRVALPTPLRRLFDYLPPQPFDLNTLIVGGRIKVPFQSRTLVGMLVAIEKNTTFAYSKLKSAIACLDTEPLLSEDAYQLCQFASDYYHYPLGEILSAALPTALRKGKALPTPFALPSIADSSNTIPDLNVGQTQAVDAITAAKQQFQVFLLDGVTGSGKTEVYLHAMECFLNAGLQVLVLVPEISLTPQTIQRFRSRFPVPMVALHSSLTEKQRLDAWLSARAGIAKIVIGTRSAIFTSFPHLGLIIVDEEHDTSFKQQDRFRYHARDLAIMRGKMKGFPVVLGSATPSLESLLNVKRGRYQHLSLPERAGNAQLPKYQLLDKRYTTCDEGLSSELLQSMREHLSQHQQVMLFLNRRGFAPVLYCPNCRFMASCERCDVKLVYHHSPQCLRCHYCDATKPIPGACPQCGTENLQAIGLGTQRVHERLQHYFPDVPIIRLDRDTTRKKGSMIQLLDAVHTTECAILLGTQMLAKGHHFPRVTLVGVIDADNGLFSADFRAAEQMGQLLVQVAGRAGRADKPGKVLIQTEHPDHPLLQTLIHAGYAAFAQNLLLEREQAMLPPFTNFAILRAEAHKEENASAFLRTVKEACVAQGDTVKAFGPVPAMLAKRKGFYCQHLLLKCTHRIALQSGLNSLLQKIDEIAAKSAVRWMLDVDPVEV